MGLHFAGSERFRVEEHPDDAEMFAIRALAEAFTGRTEDAQASLEAARKVVATNGVGDYVDHVAARVSLMRGDRDQALSIIEGLVKRRGESFTPERLRIDPNFAALRGDPRFERIVNRTP